MIKVLSAGLYTTVQDFGRYGFREYGVPYSGVMDRYASTVANALVGNPKESPVMEITMTGPTLEFFSPTIICISGADMSPTLNNTPIRNHKAIAIKQGDILRFGKLKEGYRSYLAVKGGFQTEMVMDSYSMYQNITSRFLIRKGDEISMASKGIVTKINAVLRVSTSYLTEPHLEVFKGPEFDLLSEDQKKALLANTFTISKNNNRMAYQLKESLPNTLEPIITSPVLPGTIQLTPAGTLIVLMRDAQTTGGYPRVLQLKAEAINVLSQKYLGNTIQFKLLNI